ncbi:KpsF/GutQ family sugar-phosphate isomerase [Olivibacter sp. SDN3]|uniref:KpsF/GutQ family sugar-phosphate isomerase n=1 Tax=Olivibacter sp. SDN3 TaxID=2764720 RepID=UPI001651AA79|nr:KpsF/GutQ family sugar-phosphate isomerase [Olivibacter sp. SDN3]QNL48582.1 KpsF/GutQ family sugar-phosphate isomerase [Olivibacter sp. SDN3]
MKTKFDIENIAINALKLEAEAITDLTKKINDEFINAVFAILDIKGRVIITGIGKSAIIAQKIVATMNSTGTPAIFMHAADAIHGDLGMIQKDDIVIAISKSGNTPEIKVLVPLLKNSGAKIIAMVGNTKSYLAEHADFILDTTVSREACPLNLAPTTSTTAQLAMGDALAICLLECRSFTDNDFAKYHPGGALGKRLYLKVEDLASQNQKPQVSPDSSIKEVLIEITKNRLGAVAVVNNGNIAGVITDGDIRRMLESYQNIDHLTAADIMGKTPKLIHHSELAVHALNMMRNNNITQLLVIREGAYFGIIHLHDLLKEGII